MGTEQHFPIAVAPQLQMDGLIPLVRKVEKSFSVSLALPLLILRKAGPRLARRGKKQQCLQLRGQSDVPFHGGFNEATLQLQAVILPDLEIILVLLLREPIEVFQRLVGQVLPYLPYALVEPKALTRNVYRQIGG